MRSSGGWRNGSVRGARRVLTAAAVLGAAATLSAGCGSGSLTSDTATGTVTPVPVTAPPSAAATISISGFAFSAPLTVDPGELVTVVNADPAAHTVTADDKHSFDAHVAADGRTFLTAPTVPGRYPFTCTVHPMMHGTLIVR